MAREIRRVTFAGDCPPCPHCGEPWCERCGQHYAECACPGPTQEDEWDYIELCGVLYGVRREPR